MLKRNSHLNILFCVVCVFVAIFKFCKIWFVILYCHLPEPIYSCIGSGSGWKGLLRLRNPTKTIPIQCYFVRNIRHWKVLFDICWTVFSAKCCLSRQPLVDFGKCSESRACLLYGVEWDQQTHLNWGCGAGAATQDRSAPALASKGLQAKFDKILILAWRHKVHRRGFK